MAGSQQLLSGALQLEFSSRCAGFSRECLSIRLAWHNAWFILSIVPSSIVYHSPPLVKTMYQSTFRRLKSRNAPRGLQHFFLKILKKISAIPKAASSARVSLARAFASEVGSFQKDCNAAVTSPC